MTNDQVERVDLKSLDIKEQNLEKLKEIFPAAFTEGKVDFKKLEQLLGEDVEKGIERYNFTWPGKSNAIKEISAPSLGTLKPARDESVDFDNTENLFIEADNLEALKLLQKSYLGKIKMIYIDPPYNTGKDFVYKDNFGETLKDYLQFTQQKDEDGKVFTTNPDSAGRFHSNWLNMMYPRLYLARNLLTDDGVIFVSIDDNEIENLARILNEIFGENNFIARLIWKKKSGGGNDSSSVVVEHEYILVYGKTPSAKLNSVTMSDEIKSRYKYTDEKGSYALDNLHKTAIMGYNYAVTAPDGSVVDYVYNTKLKKRTEPNWRCPENTFSLWKSQGLIEFKHDPDKGWIVLTKLYLSEDPSQKPTSLLLDYGRTRSGKDEITEIFEGSSPFDYPKTTKLLKHLISLGSTKDSIVLDFFAGSASTAHAVMAMNVDDGGDRKYIMVQLPEPTDKKSEAFKAGYMNIADIAKERIRKVAKDIKNKSEGKLGLENSNQDLGFKVFKLDKSNFNAWDGTDSDNLDAQLQLGVDRVDPKSTDEDILYEVMLKDGFMLTEKPEIKTIDGKKVYSFGDGFLLVCLEKNLTKEFIKQMAELMPKTEADATVIFLDEGFHNNDQLLVNAVEIFKSRNEKINFRIV